MISLLKYITIFILLGFWVSEASFGLGRIDEDLIWSDAPLEVVVQSYVGFLLWFLYLLAVIIGIWGGFQILTAAGEDDKVSQWKKTLLYMIVGIFLIFLAGPIIEFVIEIILSPDLAPTNNNAL